MEYLNNTGIPEIPSNPSEISELERTGNTWNTLANTSENRTGAAPASMDFSGVGRAKMDSLKDTAKEIEDMIEERSILSAKFIKEGEAMKQSINNFLLESAPKGEDDSEFARERSELRKKQLDISEMQLDEKIGCWRDIAILKKELREHNLKINEKTSRAEMLEKILNE